MGNAAARLSNRTAFNLIALTMHPRILFTLLSLLALPALSADGIFVAVGYGGRRMTSRDGQTWENVQQWADKGADDANNLMSIAFGKGKFVCVGGGGWSKETQAGHILVSTDGIEWREVAKEAFRVNPIVFGGERFVAGGPNRQLLWSLDGEKWEHGAQVAADGFPGYAMWFRHGAFGNGTFVFMGEGGAKKEFYWAIASADGTKADFRRDLPQLRALAFGAGLFVAVGNGVIVTSKDGREWAKQERDPEDKLGWILWTGGEFLTGGGKQSYASKDGLTWEPRDFKPQGTPVWTDGTRFIGTGWPGNMFFSPDGKTWKKTCQPEPAMGVNKIAFGIPGETTSAAPSSAAAPRQPQEQRAAGSPNWPFTKPAATPRR